VSSRTPLQPLQDILDAIAKIRMYTAGFEYAQFERDPKTIDAVVRNIEIIGEASRHVGPPLVPGYSSEEWTRIGAMRNRLIHDYGGTNPLRVWETIQQRPDQLELAVTEAIGNNRSQSDPSES
jgi:uncharacterized protein with HEPN domain